MTDGFKALIATAVGERDYEISFKDITEDDLPDLPVLVEVDYSTVNYKDALAITKKGRIIRRFPMICGVDIAGKVISSDDDRWQTGDEVIVNGFGISETEQGAYTQRERLSGDWLVKLPDGLSARQAMAIGTAGYTAMLCVQALEDNGVKPDGGEILVTGATGGVGSVATMILAKLGYSVVAVTGRMEHEGFLKSLGAAEVIERAELDRDAKPMEKERWAGVVDAVGGKTLATAIAQTKYGGTVTACGLAGGFALNSTVMPFILRGVKLIGIDSVMASLEKRNKAWQRLAKDIDHALLERLTTEISFSDLPSACADLLEGRTKGRMVVKIG
ncbi:MAG: oxidoreductase [Kordiimonadaceae bacterium]|jgi:acrylyl-CoA reductase (NADPH)|nr:oxidoreductase [Kordiimonadaceae bacterium]MBT6036950.1 oxidoreductase [Kordiimonadaceae bacterium]MBT6330009.1 oxidoreductase [Kordiimonadaceae bacterium]